MSTQPPPTQPTQTPATTTPRVGQPGDGAVVAAAFEAIGAGLDLLAGLDAHTLPGDVLHDAVRDLEVTDRRLAGLRAHLYTAVEAQGLWALNGAHTFTAWVRTQTQASPAKAGAITRTARALRDHLPATAAALTAGTISTEHANVLAKHTTTTPARLHALHDPDAGETFLLENASTLDAADFTNLVKHWAITTDPDAADRTWAADLNTEELVLSKTLDGYHLTGWLSLVNGAALDTALRAQTGTPTPGDQRSTPQRRANALTTLIGHLLDTGTLTPHAATEAHLNIHVPHDTLIRLAHAQTPHDNNNADSAGGTGCDHSDSSRGGGSRGGGGFGGLCRTGNPPPTGCDERPTSATGASRGASSGSAGDVHTGGPEANRSRGSRPRRSRRRHDDHEPTPGLVISTALDYDALRGAAPAELDDGTPIPHALLARLACACHLSRTIFGPASEVLDHGRTKRLFTTAQRRAIIARDRHCQFPGCNAPPAHGQIHHSIWWYAQHGTTRADDGILLCWHHHDHVHANNITITRTTTSDDTSTSTSTKGRARHPSRPRGHWQFFTRHGTQIHDPRTTGPHHPRHPER